ncbi:unnamed protein product [Timema podura]|uniref:ATP synthase F0 subunit 8 n=1 Tax=Timema podura TaxID=61482 RepID=A0ABN7NZU4_TIMPD|nr:unnamed protein product [Timema podura]
MISKNIIDTGHSSSQSTNNTKNASPGHIKHKDSSQSRGPAETWTFFYGPVAVLLSCNLVFFLWTAWRLWKDYNDVSVQQLRSMRFNGPPGQDLLWIPLPTDKFKGESDSLQDLGEIKPATPLPPVSPSTGPPD